MEDYIEKLFKQYPFIYKIGDRFFCFWNWCLFRMSEARQRGIEIQIQTLL